MANAVHLPQLFEQLRLLLVVDILEKRLEFSIHSSLSIVFISNSMQYLVAKY